MTRTTTVGALIDLAFRVRDLSWIGTQLPEELQREFEEGTATLDDFRNVEVQA